MPKGICKDSIFGTWKAGSMEIFTICEVFTGKSYVRLA